MVVVTARAEDSIGMVEFRSISERALIEHKNVLIEVFNKSVVESRMVRDRCFKDVNVRAAITQGYIEYVIEAGQQPSLEKLYGIKRFPTILLVRPDGSEVDRLVGGFFAKTLLSALEAASTGKSELGKLKEAVTDPKAGVAPHMALAEALSRRGARSEALAEYLWCLKLGPSVDAKGYRTALNSILLHIDNLAMHLPEAATALRELRTNMETTVKIDDPQSIKAAFDFNDAVQAHEENLKLFDKLPAKSLLRRTLFGSVFNELVKQKRYNDATAVLDLESYVYTAYPLSLGGDDPSSDADDKDKEVREALVERRKQHINQLTATAVEALLGVDKLEKAKRLASRAIEEQVSRDLKLNLVHAANRVATPLASEFVTWLERKVAPQAEKLK